MRRSGLGVKFRHLSVGLPRLAALLARLLTLSSLAAGCAVDRTEPQAFVGMVSAATPSAAAAGHEILEAGGNAVDAAVAAAFALAVSEPFASGLGGQAALLVHPGSNQAPIVLDGSSRAPGVLPDSVPASAIAGARASTVPSTVKVLDHALRELGSGRVSLRQVLAPAIRLARQGHRVGPYGARAYARYMGALNRSPQLRETFLSAEAKPPGVGDLLHQPRLARTLERIAEEGADSFYHGPLAREIAADMMETGGWIRLTDLESLPPPRRVAPLHGRYRGRDVYTLPPPFGGWVVLRALHLLEQAPPEELQAASPERLVWLAEVLRQAHGGRERRGRGEPPEADARLEDLIGGEASRGLPFERPGSGETTHLSVVDATGMAVGLTASINAFFGAKAAHPDLGFLYNDYLREFVLDDPHHLYALKPHAVPYSSMSPTVVARQGEVELVLGSPGSQRIISAVVQVVSRWVDGHETLPIAVAGPRIHVSGQELLIEEGMSVQPQAVRLLEARGFRLVRPLSSLASAGLNPYFGGVHAIARWEDGWQGAADPRRDGGSVPARWHAK